MTTNTSTSNRKPLRPCLEMLRRRDPEARAAAFAELSGQLCDELSGELRRLLRESRDGELRLELLEFFALELGDGIQCFDSPEAVLLAPAHGLGETALEQLDEDLRTIFENVQEPGRLRRKALEVAVLAPREWQVEAVREIWQSPEPEWRASALSCMGQLVPIDFTEEIAEGLRSPIDDLRIQAILAADARDLFELGPRMLEIAGDRAAELEVRLCAIEALPNLRPEGAPTLLRALSREAAPLGAFATDALFSLEQNERVAERLEDERKPGLPRSPLPLFVLERQVLPPAP